MSSPKGGRRPKDDYSKSLILLSFAVGVCLILGTVFSVWGGRAEERKLEKTFSLQSPEAQAEKKRWEEELIEARSAKGASPKEEEALIQTGRALENLTPYFYEEADHKCYLYQKSSTANPACFEKEVTALNSRYGVGSFEFLADEVLIQYTGLHYRRLLDKYPQSRYQDEASFHILKGRELVGHDPDVIFDKVSDWIKKYPKSPLASQAWLLLGRLYQDGWYLFKTRTFVAINMQLSGDEMDDRAMRYRGKGLWAFKQVSALFPKSQEAEMAKKEYQLLLSEKNDGVIYGLTY